MNNKSTALYTILSQPKFDTIELKRNFALLIQSLYSVLSAILEDSNVDQQYLDRFKKQMTQRHDIMQSQISSDISIIEDKRAQQLLWVAVVACLVPLLVFAAELIIKKYWKADWEFEVHIVDQRNFSVEIIRINPFILLITIHLLQYLFGNKQNI